MSATSSLTEHEIKVLKMMTGERPGEWGAWVGACLEYLADAGLCTRGPKYQITDAGRIALADIAEQRRKA